MYIGVSARYTDKRVDKALRKLGYNDCEVFYSPLIVSLTYILMLLAATAGIFSPMLFSFGHYFVISAVLICYCCLYYLVSAYSNNSFALTAADLVIINPNFPFSKQTVIPLNTITDIRIGSHTPAWRKALLFLTGNYADIQTSKGLTRYYCIGLEADAYDENLIEKTIEDFEMALRKRGINIQSSIEY